MLGFSILGRSPAQNVNILCLDFCTVAAAHQDIRSNLNISLSVIELLHALSLAEELFTLESS